MGECAMKMNWRSRGTDELHETAGALQSLDEEVITDESPIIALVEKSPKIEFPKFLSGKNFGSNFEAF